MFPVVLVPLIEFRTPLQLFHSSTISSCALFGPRPPSLSIAFTSCSPTRRRVFSYSLFTADRYYLPEVSSPFPLRFCRCLVALESSTPFLSSQASTRLPNTAISALSPLRHFSYEMINSWPVCLPSPPPLGTSCPPCSSINP